MKSIFKALFLLCALSITLSGCSEPEFEATKILAEAGDADAQSYLGTMYEIGLFVAEDDQEAVKWYRLAADQGDALAQFSLGWMYANGEGVTQNDQEAVKWYRLAAEGGLADGQRALGAMYANGTGVEQNDQEAVKLYQLAAEQGDDDARLLRDRLLRESLVLRQARAESGDAEAQVSLGRSYATGTGVAEDDQEAVRWYRLAAGVLPRFHGRL